MAAAKRRRGREPGQCFGRGRALFLALFGVHLMLIPFFPRVSGKIPLIVVTVAEVKVFVPNMAMA